MRSRTDVIARRFAAGARRVSLLPATGRNEIMEMLPRNASTAAASPNTSNMPTVTHAPRNIAWADDEEENARSTGGDDDATAMASHEQRMRRRPRLPSDRRVPHSHTREPFTVVPAPRWEMQPQSVIVGIENSTQVVPRLALPPGSFCYCCCLDKLVCAGNSNRGCLQTAWTRIVICLISRLDRLIMRGVSGSRATQAPERGMIGMLVRWPAMLTAFLAFISVFAAASYASGQHAWKNPTPESLPASHGRGLALGASAAIRSL